MQLRRRLLEEIKESEDSLRFYSLDAPDESPGRGLKRRVPKGLTLEKAGQPQRTQRETTT